MMHGQKNINSFPEDTDVTCRAQTSVISLYSYELIPESSF